MNGFIVVRRVGSVVQNLNGTIRSLWPAHNEPVNSTYGPYHWEEKPQSSTGTYGGFEQTAVSGNSIIYNPTGAEAVAFWFFPTPNGLFWMSEDPAKLDVVPL